MIKAVVFDMDDTLYMEYEYVKSGFATVNNYLQSEGVSINFYNQAMNFFDSGQRGNIFNKVLEKENIQFDQAYILRLVNIYRNHMPKIQLEDSTLNLLLHLKTTYKLGLISDGYLNAQQKKVQALGLYNYIDEIILTDALGRQCWKPSEVPFKEMENRLKLNGKELVYIGDNITKDFITAKNRGWLTIQLLRPNGEYSNIKDYSQDYQADYVIHNLMDIKEILKKFN